MPPPPERGRRWPPIWLATALSGATYCVVALAEEHTSGKASFSAGMGSTGITLAYFAHAIASRSPSRLRAATAFARLLGACATFVLVLTGTLAAGVVLAHRYWETLGYSVLQADPMGTIRGVHLAEGAIRPAWCTALVTALLIAAPPTLHLSLALARALNLLQRHGREYLRYGLIRLRSRIAPADPSQPEACDVFVSYAHRDRQAVDALVERLKSASYSVWYDPQAGLGSKFGFEINARLAIADCVVVVWSTAAIKSWWVWAEAAKGHARGVLVPAALCPSDEVPVPFNALNTARLPDELEELVSLIGKQVSSRKRAISRERPEPATRAASGN